MFPKQNALGRRLGGAINKDSKKTGLMGLLLCIFR